LIPAPLSQPVSVPYVPKTAINIKARGTPPVLARTPEAVETACWRNFKFECTSAKAKKNPKMRESAADKAESSKLKIKASR